MNNKNILIVFVLFIVGFFSFACDNTDGVKEPENLGFLEYQYDYKIMVNNAEVTRQGFRRVNLTGAEFRFPVNDTIVDSLKMKGLRMVEVLVYGGEFKKDSLFGTQPIGVSVVKLTLVDSIGLVDTTKVKMLPYSYATSSLYSSRMTKKPICLEADYNLNMMLDTTTNMVKYQHQFKGQATKNVKVIQLSGDNYQIVANGIASSKIYNLYYYGKLKKE
jgi:hypothetical protein